MKVYEPRAYAPAKYFTSRMAIVVDAILVVICIAAWAFLFMVVLP